MPCISGELQFLGVPGAGSVGGALPTYSVFAAPRWPLAKCAISNTTVRRLAKRCIAAAFRSWVRDTVLLKLQIKPSMARVFLKEYYRGDMQRLEALLGRHLPWWWLNA